jgi:thiamine-phosphate pyrophosphorylase
MADARQRHAASLRGSLHLVTDRPLCGPRGVQAVVAAAVAGGVTHVQLREKHLDTREFIAIAQALHLWLKSVGVPLIINDDVDVAETIGADGVHLGQLDLPVAAARHRLPHALIGLSIETPAQLREAELAACPCDYYGVSPVFPTTSKADAAPALGLDGLVQLRGLTAKPLIAIGGVQAVNAASLRAAGADGLAVVSAVCAAPDPAAAARALRLAMHGANFGPDQADPA